MRWGRLPTEIRGVREDSFQEFGNILHLPSIREDYPRKFEELGKILDTPRGVRGHFTKIFKEFGKNLHPRVVREHFPWEFEELGKGRFYKNSGNFCILETLGQIFQRNSQN